MKALRFEHYGPPSVLSVVEMPRPEPHGGEVVIQVKASTINPSDVKNVAGHFKSPLPRVPGRDFAGVVVAGSAEKGLEVWGSGPGFGTARDGAHAQYIVVTADCIAPKPANISMESAGAIGVPYLTAWSALVTAGNVQPGETVLIIGVSGAVGTAATQIAHWKKARVIGASIGSDNPAKADAMINTTTQQLDQAVRDLTGGKGADLVLDAVSGPMFEPGLKSLRRGGRAMAITSSKDRRVSFDVVDFYHNQLHLIGVDSVKLSGQEIVAIMNRLRPGFEEGQLQAPSVATWPLDRAVEAYQTVERGTRTKQVLLP
jgi:NADPH:quinone reductase